MVIKLGIITLQKKIGMVRQGNGNDWQNFLGKQSVWRHTIVGWYGILVKKPTPSETVFLNSNIENNIYMAQLEGFTFVGGEQKVCKLQKLFMDLKKISKLEYPIRTHDQTVLFCKNL